LTNAARAGFFSGNNWIILACVAHDWISWTKLKFFVLAIAE
jgi:hypothetical protein